MLVRFYLKYCTRFGQSVFIEIRESGKEESFRVNLNYLNNEYWKGELELPKRKKKRIFHYRYFLSEDGRQPEADFWPERRLELNPGWKSVEVADDWQDVQLGGAVYKSRAFAHLLGKRNMAKAGKDDTGGSHQFNVHTPLLPPGKAVCISGSSSEAGSWDENRFLAMIPAGPNTWTVSMDMPPGSFPFEYKFGMYDPASGKLEAYEEGPNRIVIRPDIQADRIIHNRFAVFGNHAWRGCGVNIQLSSLRSGNSMGVGDFSDLRKMIDWSASVGIRMIQLLPINDTTATHTNKDSYPYSAISAFALHPIFLDIRKMARSAGVKISKDWAGESAALNDSETLEYAQVLQLKLRAVRSLFEIECDQIQNREDFTEFFAKHHYWLMPYAAFCYLRDTNGSSDPRAWGDFSIYNEEKVRGLVSENSSCHKEILFHYYLQFHLDAQLQDAVKYAHRKGVIIKGDLPIGVGRHSVDTWMEPGLFHMDMQAGAPPDAFTAKGQNWSFPTYNWEVMQRDHYGWWRKRLQHMSHYFDAIRIDHVLGFFRIWSVPLHAIEGILGYFVPAHPLDADDFRKEGIAFDEARYCEPFIDDDVIASVFGSDASWFRRNALENGVLKNELRTQRGISDWCRENGVADEIRKSLLELTSQVILLKEEGSTGKYHFRISMQDTASFKKLPPHEKSLLEKMYHRYFFETQNSLWFQSAQSKLDAIQHGSDMMICAEDLGMVPDMVEGVLKGREMLALQVERMPKRAGALFSDPAHAPYLSVVTPSTHDMSSIREWWEEDRDVTKEYYHGQLGHGDEPPVYCEPAVCSEIIARHLHSPAMWAVFLLQDLFSMDDSCRRTNPAADRINNPANPDHFWNYRMHMKLESMPGLTEFNNRISRMIRESGR